MKRKATRSDVLRQLDERDVHQRLLINKRRSSGDERASVVKEKLSDNSVAWNVEFGLAGDPPSLRLACLDQSHAQQLADELNRLAWVEILG